ncbi:hypothetical protein [Streptomyces albogriseolus]|uniref:hypothetical protein n=1 Tax=Streptomyces albogriseolus TaxID=1887 RepID=UPI003EB9600A
MLDADDPHLVAAGVEFTLERREERLDLAAVVRLLLRHAGAAPRSRGGRLRQRGWATCCTTWSAASWPGYREPATVHFAVLAPRRPS